MNLKKLDPVTYLLRSILSGSILTRLRMKLPFFHTYLNFVITSYIINGTKSDNR